MVKGAKPQTQAKKASSSTTTSSTKGFFSQIQDEKASITAQITTSSNPSSSTTSTTSSNASSSTTSTTSTTPSTSNKTISHKPYWMEGLINAKLKTWSHNSFDVSNPSAGYYRSDSRWKEFGESTAKVYKQDGTFLNNWSDNHKTNYLYVPINYSAKSEGDYYPSGLNGMRKGFDWIELESRGQLRYFAESNRLNRTDTNNRYRKRNWGDYRHEKIVNKFFRAPLYFRTYWMNPNSHKYGRKCPACNGDDNRKVYNCGGFLWTHVGGKDKDSQAKEELDKRNQECKSGKKKCANSSYTWKYEDQLADDSFNDTSWNYAYPPRLRKGSDNNQWWDQLEGWDGNQDCYDNRDSYQFWKLGAVPHLRKLTNIIDKIANNTKYISSIQLGSSEYDISATVPSLGSSSSGSTTSISHFGIVRSVGTQINNESDFFKFLVNSCNSKNCANLKHLLENAKAAIERASNAGSTSIEKMSAPVNKFTVSDATYKTLVKTFNKTASPYGFYSSKSEFNPYTFTNGESIYLAVPTKPDQYPNYYENIDNIGMMQKLMQSLIDLSNSTFIEQSRTDFPISFTKTNSLVIGYEPLSKDVVYKAKFNILNRYNHIINLILSNKESEAKEEIKNLFMDNDKKLDAVLWRSGFIFNLLNTLLGSDFDKYIPYIGKDVVFFKNSEQTKIANAAPETYTTKSNISIASVAAKDGKAISNDYRNFGIDGTSVSLASRSYNVIDFLKSTVKEVTNEIAYPPKDAAKTSSIKSSIQIDTKGEMNGVERLKFKLSIDDAVVSKSKTSYMNGFVETVNSNPCCCHMNKNDASYYLDGNKTSITYTQLNKPCSNAKVEWKQGCMVSIPLTYYSINIRKLIEDKLNDEILRYADNNAAYSIEPELVSLKIGDVEVYKDDISSSESGSGLAHKVTVAGNKETFDFVVNTSATADSIKINLVHQKDVKKSSMKCFSQILPDVDNANKIDRSCAKDKQKAQIGLGTSDFPNKEADGLMPFSNVNGEVYLPDDDLIDTKKTFKNIRESFGLSSITLNDNCIDIEADLKYRVIGSDADFSNTQVLTPFKPTNTLYIMTNEFANFCSKVIEMNIDYIYKDIYNSVIQNKSCNALHWFFTHKDEIAQAKYKNMPFGPMMMYNDQSYVLNYRYFASQYGIGYETINNAKCPFTTRIIPDKLIVSLEEGKEIQNNDLLLNYFDVYMRDLVMSMTQSRSYDDNEYYVIRFPKLGNLLNITRASYNTLMNGSVVEYSTNLDDGTGCLFASIKQDDPVILISPIELSSSKINDMYRAHKIFSGSNFTINVPTVIVNNGNTDNDNVKTLRIGCNKWYCYVSPSLSSKTNNGNQDLYITYPTNTSELADVYTFMKWNKGIRD